VLTGAESAGFPKVNADVEEVVSAGFPNNDDPAGASAFASCPKANPVDAGLSAVSAGFPNNDEVTGASVFAGCPKVNPVDAGLSAGAPIPNAGAGVVAAAPNAPAPPALNENAGFGASVGAAVGCPNVKLDEVGLGSSCAGPEPKVNAPEVVVVLFPNIPPGAGAVAGVLPKVNPVEAGLSTAGVPKPPKAGAGVAALLPNIPPFIGAADVLPKPVLAPPNIPPLTPFAGAGVEGARLANGFAAFGVSPNVKLPPVPLPNDDAGAGEGAPPNEKFGAPGVPPFVAPNPPAPPRFPKTLGSGVEGPAAAALAAAPVPLPTFLFKGAILNIAVSTVQRNFAVSLSQGTPEFGNHKELGKPKRQRT
jgi:hypothetical protein